MTTGLLRAGTTASKRPTSRSPTARASRAGPCTNAAGSSAGSGSSRWARGGISVSICTGFIAIDYHRNRHGGVKIPGVEDGNFTPLERHDMLQAITGRLLVPQHPDLIFSLLPEKWLTPGNGGIAFRGLTYDGDVLDEIHGVRPGTYRARKAKVPFLFDPRDRPNPDMALQPPQRPHLRARVEGLPPPRCAPDRCRRQKARKLIRARGGNGVVSRRNALCVRMG